jgi:hypothetical protein
MLFARQVHGATNAATRLDVKASEPSARQEDGADEIAVEKDLPRQDRDILEQTPKDETAFNQRGRHVGERVEV